ncbi:ureidoglycolate dehydrogenase (NAD(+)) [Drosophila guanche]|uniref:Blast:Malate dehydrogenase n=1 Tax=Drosophila guanche TaxID=7266 RepID=A0A3B0JP13_DROGU|nr:ureidoglycolate dehydrogenase (NAD(+)) [Drosophila guanche]SPP83977.1 blast:Malate dehydrogenase [Drosophila guanche]
MRVVGSFIDVLRRIRLKLNTAKALNDATLKNRSPKTELQCPETHIMGETGTVTPPREWLWTKRTKIDVEFDKLSSLPEQQQNALFWQNLKRVLLICGGQEKPGELEDKFVMEASGKIVEIMEAHRFVKDVFAAMDVPWDSATDMADSLIAADYMGHRSMGIHRLPSIAADLLNSTITASAMPEIIKEKPSVALVDGCNAPGPVVGKFCMDLALRKARTVGIGWVGARHSNCIGMASWYAWRALDQRMIGVCMSNAAPTLVPAGGIEAVLGENPIACAASGAKEQFVADFGMSAVSVADLELSYCNGNAKQLPPLAALDSEGRETTFTAEALRSQRLRAFQPEYKGFGLAAMVDIMCGVMTGARYATRLQQRGVYNADNAPANLGQVFIAIDPMRFCASFEDRLIDFHRLLRSATPCQKALPPLVPGDKEFAHMQAVDDQGGLFMSPCTLGVLKELAEQLIIEPLQMKPVEKRA